MNFRVILLAALLSGLFSSCLGPNMINRWVAKEYGGTPPTPVKKKSDFISVTSTIPEMPNRISVTEKNTSKLLPLIFYWQYDYRNTCTLNPQIPLNNFTNTLWSYGSGKLKRKLGANRLELTIEHLPNVFTVDDKGHIIVIIIYPIGWDVLSVQPKPENMVVSYRVLSPDGAEVKKGSLTIPDIDKTLGLEMFQSLKKRTMQYLDQYNTNISLMTRKFADQLEQEL